jgi:hypothetical protein
MGDEINKEYEDFKEYLNKKDLRLKLFVDFDLDDDIDTVLNELNGKEVIF